MARLGIYTGVFANDGLGDTLLSAAIKTNSNFIEIYNFLGDGNDLGSSTIESLSVTGVSTFQSDLFVQGETTLGVVTATTIAGHFDGQLNTPGNVYYVETGGHDANSGTNLNQPLSSIVNALSLATNGDTVKIGAGVFTEVFPMTIPKGVHVVGMGLRSTFIQPTDATKQNDAFLLNGDCTVEDLTVGNFFEPGVGFKFANNANTTNRSPYVQRVTVLNKGSVTSVGDPYGYDTGHSPPTSYKAGRGALIDGSVVSPTTLEPAILFNECTFITPNNIALEMTNGARSEWVNCFTYFAEKGIYAHDGAVGLASAGYLRVKTPSLSGSTPQANDELYYLESNSSSATYSQSGTSLTITKVGHGLTVGDRVFADFSSGSASDGFYYVSGYTDVDNFVVTAPSATTSGDLSYKSAIGFGTVVSYDVFSGISSILGKGEGLFSIPTARSGKTVTAFGDAALETSIKKFGTASLKLDGVDDYAKVTSNADFGFGTDDFTVEVFVRPDTLITSNKILLDMRSLSDSDSALHVEITSDDPFAGTNYITVGYGNTTIITGTTSLNLNTFTHIAVSREAGSTKLFVGGTQDGSTYSDTNDYGVSKPLTIGSKHDGANYVSGYLDELRVSRTARYTSNFTVPSSPFVSDGNEKILLHFDGVTGSTLFSDSSIPTQDIRWVRSGSTVATDTKISLADYQKFGAEMRSIGSASVFGQYGVDVDGPGSTLRLFAYNFGHIGAGKDFTQDESLVNQENEVSVSNNGRAYFVSIDQGGDFRVGDAFYVNQEEGNVNFGGQEFSINSLSDLNITNGTNTTTITPTTLTVGNIQLTDNQIISTSGDINLDPSGTNRTNVFGNFLVTGITTFKSDVKLENTDTLTFGDNNDLQIYSDGVDSYINHIGIGTLRIQSTDRIYNKSNYFDFVDGSTVPMAKFNNDVSPHVELYYGGSKKFETTGYGLTVTGGVYVSGISTFSQGINAEGYVAFRGDTYTASWNPDGYLQFPDGSYIGFGGVNDLTIQHDGTNSSISNREGDLIIETIAAGEGPGGDDIIIKSRDDFEVQVAGGTTAIYATGGGSVVLTHDGSTKFETTGIGVSISNGGNNNATIAGPATLTLDPAGVGDNTGVVVIKGDLQVDGTQTIVNSTIVTVEDKNITLGSGSLNDAAADTGGITLESGDGNKTFNWINSTDSWTSSENFDIANTKTYKIAGTDVLTSTSLGTNVTTSFLTTVGTLSVLNVGGNVNVTGVSTFVGVTTFQANATFQSDLLVAGVINSNTDVQINGTSVLTTASDDAVALAIALG